MDATRLNMNGGFFSGFCSFFRNRSYSSRIVIRKSLKIIFYQYAESDGARRIVNSGHDGLLPQSRPNKVTYSTRTPVNNAAE